GAGYRDLTGAGGYPLEVIAFADWFPLVEIAVGIVQIALRIFRPQLFGKQEYAVIYVVDIKPAEGFARCRQAGAIPEFEDAPLLQHRRVLVVGFQHERSQPEECLTRRVPVDVDAQVRLD